MCTPRGLPCTDLTFRAWLSMMASSSGQGILAHKAHEPGRVDEDDPNHQLREGGCTTIVRGEDGQVLSGGGDGKIILWAVKTEPTFALEKLKELFDSTKVDPDGPPRMFTGKARPANPHPPPQLGTSAA